MTAPSAPVAAPAGEAATSTSRVASLLRPRSSGGPPLFREHRYLTWAVLIAAIAVVAPSLFTSQADQLSLNVWLAYAVAGVGFYWVFGLAGRFAFCQTLMMALGGYVSAWITLKLGPGWFLVGVVGAMAVTGLLAAVIGIILARAQDFYFAIGTLAVTQVGTVVLSHTTSFSGAAGSTVGIAVPVIFGYTFQSYLSMFWLSLVVLAVVLLFAIFLERSPLRRHAIAARENAMVARSSGVSVVRTQTMLFAFGSMLGGLSGALLGAVNSTVDVNSYGTSLAIGIFLMLFIGGVGSAWGPVVGAAFYVAMPQVLSSLAQYENIVYGAVLLVVIIVFPEGLVGGLRLVTKRITRRPPSTSSGLSLLTRLAAILPNRPRSEHHAPPS
jgi:branched-chain amino acid transport system permease protein